MKRFHSVIAVLIMSGGLCIVPGCSTSWKRIKADRPYNHVREAVEQQLDLYDTPQEAYTACWIEERLTTGVSREEVAQIALTNQLALTTTLEELGIAQADLVQAGIYKNPYMLNTFNAASLNTAASNDAEVGIEIDFSISDSWQLPKRKRVAQEGLTAKQLELTANLIDRVVQVQRLYDTCLALQAKKEYAIQRYTLLHKLINHADLKKDASLGEQVTKHTLQATYVGWHLATINYEQQLKLAYIALREALAINPFFTTTKLTSLLEYTSKPLIACALLEQAALEHSYEVVLAQTKIKQAQAVVGFEHSRFLDDFVIGYIFEKNSDGTNTSGLEVNLSLPIFDNNRAGIARANFALTKAYKELAMAKRRILTKVRQLYVQLDLAQQSIPLHTESIMHYQDGLKVGGTMPSIETMYLLAVPSIYQSIFDTQVLLLDVYVQARDSARQLEALTGRSVYACVGDGGIVEQQKPMLTLHDLKIPKL